MLCVLLSPLAVTEWNTLAANNVMRQQMGAFCRRQGVILAGVQTFPSQSLSRTKPFPDKTFPGQLLFGTDVSWTSYTKEFSCT